MPLIEITVAEGHTRDQKRALLEAVTEATHRSLNVPIGSVRVWVNEVPATDFMVGGETMAERQGVPLPNRAPAKSNAPAIPGVTVPAKE